MKYKVIKGFYDKENPNDHYQIGRLYPRDGVKPSDKRIKALGKGGYIDIPKEAPKKEEPKEEEAPKKEEKPKKDSK